MGWLPVLNHAPGKLGPLTEGFDPAREYEFRRGFDGEPWAGRFNDWHTHFNVAGLWFREVRL